MRAISTEISPETGAGGFILPNDRVDVILSRRDAKRRKPAGVETHVSETILVNIRVLAIDQTVEREGRPEGRGRQDRDAGAHAAPGRMLALSRQLGTLSLALRSLADAGEMTLPEDDRNTKPPASTPCASASAP